MIHCCTVVAVAAIAVLSVSSCRSAKDIQIVTETKYIHDTTSVEVHDTVATVFVRTDSVDRYVENTVYVDTNGIVHQKEVERLTRYINLQDNQYISKIRGYESKIKNLEEKLSEKEKVTEVKAPIKGWQKFLMWTGVLTWIVAVVVFVLWFKKTMFDNE